ncbi:hypothetical protein CSAL01_07287 [Colletotrichum salicis]|uniref:Methyltransferase domain-containing protein n=1 Tax=Colletotrichum salicis TaxID=1209931 RepID=A0A135V5H6_9PEZI|nr:hypothetical protein CSAL01_07287 [Colletotrichum salicis]
MMSNEQQQPGGDNGPIIIADDFAGLSNHLLQNADDSSPDRATLGLAPPAQPGYKVKRVLDVGTGTGIWCTEFGDEYPDAEASTRPFGCWYRSVSSSNSIVRVPPNVKFEVDDLEEPWTYHTKFDYIHTRVMTSSIADWKRFFKQSYKLASTPRPKANTSPSKSSFLEPGGYIELQEAHMRPNCDDDTLKPTSPLIEWVDRLEEACNIFGRPFINCPSLKPLLEEVGFEGVSVTKYKWPINAWPKDPYYRELGIWNLENMLEGVEGWSMAPFTRALNWTKEEVNVFLISVRNELKNKNVYAYIPVYMIRARKPLKTAEDDEEAS